jgi:hypothetical protein
MKKFIAITLLSSLFPLPNSLFAMPLKWTCNFPEASAVSFSVYQGETVSFMPEFKINGIAKPLQIEGIYYQTNGMENAWWKLDGNTFSPTNDVGAYAYRFFVLAAGEGGKNYQANGTLRMLPSPGFVPRYIPLPKEVLDFSAFEIRNEPWADADATKEAISLSKSLGAIVLGEDCQLVSTNYNSATKMPHLYLRFKIKNEETGSNEWKIVWSEKTRWDWLDDLLATNYYSMSEIDSRLSDKADRAWGHYDSHTGLYAPDGFTWISSPAIAIAGGLAYQRIATSEGAVWVLESNGMTTITGGETNGFFRISDDKGNAIFEISKGSEVVVGATASSARTESIMGVTHIFVTYNIDSAEHPKIEVTNDLKSHDWKTEDDSSCLANVAWTGFSGAWTAEIWSKQVEPQLFVKATYKKGTRDTIKHNAPMAITELLIDGQYYKIKVDTIDGKKVLVLE